VGQASTDTSRIDTVDEPQPETSVSSLAEADRYCSPGGGRSDRIPHILERNARLVVLKNALTRGLADAEAGRVSVAADVFARLEARYLANVATHT
jgi:antitoxin ParD1/3/4